MAYWALLWTTTAVVQSVSPDSGAAKAGLKAGDAIVRIDGQPIKERTDVAAIMSQKAAGDKVRLTFVRDGKEQVAEVMLGEAPAAGNNAAAAALPRCWRTLQKYRALQQELSKAVADKDFAKAIEICRQQAACR